MPLAAIATGLFATIYAIITVKLKANQTIAGIALNIFAIALAIFFIESDINPTGAGDKISIQKHLFNFADTNKNFA
jgi:ABC-type uncharacterized transport system permease subunit